MKYPAQTIPFLINKGLSRNTTGVAIATKKNGEWTEMSVQDFQTKARHLALALHKLGIKKGDRISIHAENSAYWLIIDLAALSIGAIDVPIYTTQPGDQIEFILGDSGSRIHFVSDDVLFDPNAAHVKAVKNVEHIISVYKSSHDDVKLLDDIIAIGAELDKENPALYEQLLAEVHPDDLATFMYTSGTTGMPKGVMLTHNNIGSNLQSVEAYLPFDIEANRGHKVLSFLPLSHSFERVVSYNFIHVGYPLYYIEKIDEIVKDIQHVKPIFFATVPRLLEKLHAGFKGKSSELSGLKKKLFEWAIGLAEEYDVEKPNAQGFKKKIADKLIYSKLREALGGNLNAVISGGAAVSAEILSFINGIGVLCSQGYGLTETSPVLTTMKREELRAGTAGRPIPDVFLKIAEDGEILAKGPNIMKGYFNQPEKTAEVFTEDGWFCTGDIGKIDDRGYLFITDRKKALFKLSTGKYVAPQHIENLLVNSMFIEQSIVLGNSRKFCSALVIPDFNNIRNFMQLGSDVSNEEILANPKVQTLLDGEVQKVNKHLPQWEQVKKYQFLERAFTIESGEMTPTMKIKRNVVNDHYKDKIESMYME
ncbi:long-chain fatty acid--CoA ligase [bacterium]|nr:MAG: long-chain fatty acid--CoA ligase [bacterium]